MKPKPTVIEKGFKRFEYKGIPVVIREWFPENKLGFYNESTGVITIVDIETQQITTIKDADFSFKI